MHTCIADKLDVKKSSLSCSAFENSEISYSRVHCQVAIASSFCFWLLAYVSAIDDCRIGSNVPESQ